MSMKPMSVRYKPEGQAATFTVDAYPNRRYFRPRIDLVRLGSETVDNVVSYKTILKVDNDDFSLRPGMTATAEIVTAERENVLLVPNAALRFTPPKPTANAESNSRRRAAGQPDAPSARARKPAQIRDGWRPTKKAARARVWVLRDGQPVAVSVTVGQSSDGRMTEVSGAGLAVGHAGDHRQPECENESASEHAPPAEPR
jgi:HlyD family secretion protein